MKNVAPVPTVVVRERRRCTMCSGWLHRRHLRELHRGCVRRKRAKMPGDGNSGCLECAAHCSGHLGHLGDGAGHLVHTAVCLVQGGGYLRYSARYLRYLREILMTSRRVLAGCQWQATYRRMSYTTGVFAEARPAITEPHLKCCALYYISEQLLRATP